MSKPTLSVSRLLVASVVLVIGISACSSSSKASGTKTTTAPASSATTSAHTDAVTIKDYAFGPKSITVKAGTKVTWTNKDQFAHAIKDSATDQSGAMNIDPNASYSHTYSTPGTYPYVCAIHPNMHGTVKVTAS
jgi:plastocyanin